MKIVFMGTPDFAVPCLEELYKNNYQIPLVVTQPDRPKGRGKNMAFPPVKEKALEYDLTVLQPENVNNVDTVDILRDINPDFIVVVAFGQILRESILSIPKKGCINVHASLLPYYRGAAPINWSIINGESKTGITTMLMNKGLDTGDILLKDEISIEDDDNAGTLHDKLMMLGSKVLIDTLKGIENEEIYPTPQDHTKSTYAATMDKKLGEINWDKSALEIRNLVRGTYPWPGAYFNYSDNKVKIIQADICDKFKSGVPGQVVDVNDSGIYVNTKNGCIIIKKVQFPGKKKMKVKEYLKGNNFDVGTILK